MLVEVPGFDRDVLYFVSAASGAGSVELPFDRGILGTEVIHFERSGPRVLVVAQATRYRAVGGSAAQVENVKDSFASSVLAALPVEADEAGRVLVDATPLFMRDAADVEGRLRRVNQGAFRFDGARSGFHAPRIKSFPLNAEVETIVTFGAENPGLLVNNVTPDGRSFTMRIHHSFLKAPEGYTPRVADPRIGVSTITFRDYAKPFNEDTETQWITRWRLEKQDPAAAMSEPKVPIVFYLDAGIPEPTRSAMRAGALWWNKAFEAAGFRNAVQVKDPTPDMDPMDIRYSWILWINRDERGFSSGGTFRDPRTGEVLGSKTRMDSHRVRTIGNYWESYTPTSGAGGDEALMTADAGLLTALAAEQPSAGMPAAERDLVLLRQTLLTAHELGHVMGFQHNFSASLDNFGSVMEYPTPRVKVVNGKLDLSEAFQREVGPYDEMMARYAYTVFPAGQEKPGLEGVIRDMRAQGLHYLPETDPRWSWYDDRATPQEYLRETMAARTLMLASYGPNILRAGEPMGALRDARLWMTYLHHRWAIEAGQRYVGGMFHTYHVKGDPGAPTEIVPAATQREVLGLLLAAVAPPALELPEALLAQLHAPSQQQPRGPLERLCLRPPAGRAHHRRDGARRPVAAGAGGAAGGVCRSPAAGAHVARGGDRGVEGDVGPARAGVVHAGVAAPGDGARGARRSDDARRPRRCHPRGARRRAPGDPEAGPGPRRAPRRRGDGRSAPASGRSRYRALSAESRGERAEVRGARVGGAAAVALPAQPWPALGRGRQLTPPR